MSRFTTLNSYSLLFFLSLQFTATANAANTQWKYQETRDPFDDSIDLMKVTTLAEGTSGGWLSISCVVKVKRFTLNIVSGELRVGESATSKASDNFRYRIDKTQPKVITMTQVIDGAASSNNISLTILKDIVGGGSKIVTQPIVESTKSHIEKFNIGGASEPVKRIIDACS